MHSAEIKTSSTASPNVQAKWQPFFSKEGQDGFFSKSNEASPSFFNIPTVQPKLTIGAPDDKYEKEADTMADQVVQRLSQGNEKENEKISANGIENNQFIQPKCAECEEEGNVQKKSEPLINNITRIQRKPIFESNNEFPQENIQRKSNGNLDASSNNIEHRLNATGGKGQKLPPQIQRSMGGSLGADFSHVNIHTDSSAIQMSRDLNAQAFTHGRDIYFNSGKYKTNSKSGMHLLAHELTHTVQQGAAKPTIQKEESLENSNTKPLEKTKDILSSSQARIQNKSQNPPNLKSDSKPSSNIASENISSKAISNPTRINPSKHIQLKCEECEHEEIKENEADKQNIQLKSFDSDENGRIKKDEFMAGRSWEEAQADKIIMFKRANFLQRKSDSPTDESSRRKRIVEVAKEEIGKVEARRDDGSGRRYGADRLLDYFHLAAPDEWSDEVIEHTKYTMEDNQFPHWCAIFSIYTIKKAGIDIGDWKMGTGVSKSNTLKQTNSPQPGDIGYIHKPWRHHCIIKEINGDSVKSIDGNSGTKSEVIERTRPKSEYTLFLTPFTGSEKYIQKKEADINNESTSSNLESQLNTTSGKGSQIDSNTQNEMEAGFGADFSGVNIHTDSNAAKMSNDLGAQAFTHGNDIYFNEEKYNPQSTSGKHLLAHELTHTVQQGNNSSHNVQKSGDSDSEELTLPTTKVDISNNFNLPSIWQTYLDAQRRVINFDLPVKIGSNYEGIIKIRRLGRIRDGQNGRYDLSQRPRNQYINVLGLQQLNFLRNQGITPVLVLHNFGENRTTKGYLSVRTGERVIGDVIGLLNAINNNLEALGFLGLDRFQVPNGGVENRFENGSLSFQLTDLSTTIDGYIEATGGLGIQSGEFTFNINANVDVAGLANGEFSVSRDEEGRLNGRGEIQADIGNVQATIKAEYEDGAVTIHGTGRIESEKFTGEITLLVTDAARSRQMMNAALGVETMDSEAEAPRESNTAKTPNNQVLAGWGEVQAEITPWLEGTSKIGIDAEGHITIVGEIVVPDEIELMEQRGKKVQLFETEIRAGYGIPLVGQVFLFASVGMFVNAGFGPLVLKNVGFRGTYSTDPSVLQHFSITGTLGINAFAVLGLEAEAGVGVTIIGHDVKAGVNVTAAAGLRAYAEATPTLEYIETAAPEGGKVGESHLRGHFEAAAQLFLQLSGALFYELDSPWWSPAPDGREESPLGEVQYPIGDSLGIGADIDWLIGSSEAPELSFSPIEFDPEKFTADVMADPPPRRDGNSEAEEAGEWQDANAQSNHNENPEAIEGGEGLPTSPRQEENLRNLPDEQKYMRALDEMARLENVNPKPTENVVEEKARRVKSRYDIDQIRLRDQREEVVFVFVKHKWEDNSARLIQINLLSGAEKKTLIDNGLAALHEKEQRKAEEGKISRDEAVETARETLNEHEVFTSIDVIDGNNRWDYRYAASPEKTEQSSMLKDEVEDVELPFLVKWLNKKVTNSDGSLKDDFIQDFTRDGNKDDGKMAYVLRESELGYKIARGSGFAEKYPRIYITARGNENEEGYLIEGTESNYKPTHRNFVPKQIKISQQSGVYTATYEMLSADGSQTANFTISISFEEAVEGVSNKTEKRVVEGQNLSNKPKGIGRGAWDSASQGFDNAHIIGDQFGGSGKNVGLNIHPSSPDYNRRKMAEVENSIANFFKRSDQNYNLKVSATLTDDKETGTDLRQILDQEFDKDSRATIARSGASEELIATAENRLIQKLQREITNDLRNLPAQFSQVDYESESLDTDFEMSVVDSSENNSFRRTVTDQENNGKKSKKISIGLDTGFETLKERFKNDEVNTGEKIEPIN